MGSVTIRLQRLPLSATASDIRSFFSGLRIPDGAVHIIGGEDGDAFIGFASDEDARLAMSRSGGKIHSTEIRLLLSSKTELEQVLARAKSGKPRLPMPSRPIASNPSRWGPANPPVQERPTPSRYPPDMNGSQPAYTKIEPKIPQEPIYSRVPPNNQPYQANYAQREEKPYGYNAQTSQPQRQPNVRQMNYGEIETSYEASGYKSPTGYQPNIQQKEVDYKGYGYMASEDKKPDQRQPILPNRDMIDGPKAPPPQQFRQQSPAGMPPHVARGGGGQQQFNNSSYQQNGVPSDPIPRREEPPRQYNQPPPSDNHRYPPQQNFPPRQSRFEQESRPPPGRFPPQEQQRYPPPAQNETWGDRDSEPVSYFELPFADSWRGNMEQTWENRPPPASHPPPSFDRQMPEKRPYGFEKNRFNNGPPPSTGINSPPMNNYGPRGGFDNRPKPAPILRFLELTRLPPDLIRPAALESFLRPSQPFSVSSVKIVFSPQGIHLASLIRIESEEDFNRITTRDGDQGIRVRPTSRQAFEEAVDGIPPVQEFQDDRRPPSRGNEPPSRERSPRRRRSRSPIRKAKKSRSRSPRRRGVRSRSPTRRIGQPGRQNPNRWCLALTNVPFKIEPEEVMAWLCERVRPTKLTRTFYADGNASDRWVAEFENPTSMERARNHRIPLHGRQVKFMIIDNEYADEILAIEDRYGETKKKEYDLKQMAELQLQHLNGTIGPHGVPRFFNNPASSVPTAVQQQHYPPQGPARQNFSVGPHAALLGNSPNSPNKTVRGGFFGARGRGRGFSTGIDDGDYVNSSPLVPYNGPPGYAKRGRMEERRSDEMTCDRDLFASLGPSGTVVACSGFPGDVTLHDILDFFRDFPVDSDSVKIKLNDNNQGTGDAVLHIPDSELARSALIRLNGMDVKGHVVHLSLPVY